MKKILIAGAGAAGCMAALTLLEQGLDPEDLLLVDAAKKAAKKIYVTGNGRCNLANSKMDKSCYYSDSGDPLTFIGAFRPQQYFREHGILVHERNGYWYPRTDQAATIAGYFERRLLGAGVRIRLNTRILSIEKTGDGFSCLLEQDKKRETIRCERLVLALGGPAGESGALAGSGFELAEHLGHRVLAPHPALTDLQVSDPYISAAAGVRTIGEVTACGRTENGEIQFTKSGISGIPVFQVSRLISGALQEGNTKVPVTLDLLPEISKEELQEIREERRKHLSSYLAGDLLFGLVPSALSSFLVRRLHLADEKKMKNVADADEMLDQLFSSLKNLPLSAVGTGGFAHAQVCAGGIPLSEVDADTMESKCCPGLYPVGELLDADGICGGYNLTFAFATGYKAGLAISRL